MSEIGSRIQQLRKTARLTQTELAGKVGISYAQISRYENRGAQPPAEVLSRLAQVLNTSVDYLVNGNSDEKAGRFLTDAQLLNYFRELDQLPDSEKDTILKVLAALIRDFKTKKAYAG